MSKDFIVYNAENEEIKQKIGKVVRSAREESGMTQKELGESIGSNQGAVSTIENGNQIPSIKMINRIAKALDAKLKLPNIILNG